MHHWLTGDGRSCQKALYFYTEPGRSANTACGGWGAVLLSFSAIEIHKVLFCMLSKIRALPPQTA